MSFKVAKRFWDDVDVAHTKAGYVVRLDGRVVKTPSKADLAVPTQDAAMLIAAEWDGIETEIDPAAMPATRWANAAVDKVSHQHSDVVEMLCEYGGTDLLCYRAAHPQELADRQATAWDAPLLWCAKTLDAPLVVTQGVIPVDQPNQSLVNFQAEVAGFEPFTLSAFHDLVVISGSLVLSLAVAKRKMSAEEAWTTSRVDEIWQIEQWGEDDDAAQASELKHQNFVFAEKLLHSVGI